VLSHTKLSNKLSSSLVEQFLSIIGFLHMHRTFAEAEPQPAGV